MGTAMLRIILVDGHALVRTGYRRLPDAEPGLQVVAKGDAALSELTPREFDVLRMPVLSESLLQIASSTQLIPKTVFNDLSLIRQKFDVDNDFKLLYLAARRGLVTLGPLQEMLPACTGHALGMAGQRAETGHRDRPGGSNRFDNGAGKCCSP
ncbi:MAG: DNA-binding NarL/FixJ family response regulator [Janthinobacterium sp.]|jgi:DNA-binding NarL/FixJ family response regulator